MNDPYDNPIRVGQAISALGKGEPVVIAGEDRSAIVLAASLASTTWTAWTVRHSSGLLCVALHDDLADKLDLSPLRPAAADTGTVYAVSVDAADGVTTGISAADRAHCARVLANPASRPADLTRPGHVIPIRVSRTAGRAHYGLPEAALDLCAQAGLPEVGLLATMVTDVGPLATMCEARALAEEYGLVVVTQDQLAGRCLESRIRRVEWIEWPSRSGVQRTGVYADDTGLQHFVVFGHRPGPAHVHVECLQGTIAAGACHCRAHLDTALARLSDEGGMLVYLRPSRHGRHQEMGRAETALSTVIQAYAEREAAR
ncbi:MULTISPECIES: 3,4-dihydroxy-2-butanone-4-phosphate synthase [unclassified Amycolatopsis]|uniref:3,4-dihydroxy-2-butanone-4-phosphate synthase n=1 Tax=unclassified Amycolatopsis TaxID=2618356 RepID=UPI001C6A8313|nr:3,4-dihydroxy-2-butanone-4-phosphate synthase [Amycolatopsis sp. DSM 110486]QYN20209.1 3,4-dihydroxy-2-butanone-4-phosphate synthase [Amycolatopsis sp. DSM 110486]